MPAARLSEGQKVEVVNRFRGGEGLQGLAEVFGCSPNTVSRVVKAALEPGEYERIKEQRARRGGSGAADPVDPQPAAAIPEPSGHAEVPAIDPPPQIDRPAQLDADPEIQPLQQADADAGEVSQDRGGSQPGSSATRQLDSQPPVQASQEEDPAVLAIDDADDFGADDSDEEDADDDLFDQEVEQQEGNTFVPVPLLEFVDDHTEIRPLPLAAADLSGSAWMLVDKTVELQARPLSEFTELGRLPADEQDRQALTVFVNPRQAKRQCGRTQRVIKIPDPAVFHRTAPYLLAQGISRVVIEGSLFALPGS